MIKKSKFLNPLLILVIIFSLVLAIVLPFAKVLYWAKTDKEISFKVKSGQGTRDIAKNLKELGAIKSSFIFNLYVYSRHMYLQSGNYKIRPDSNLVNIAEMIHEGRVEEFVVTIPEGWRATQIDKILAEKGIAKPSEFLNLAKTKEGYLFPDTYSFSLDVKPESIVQIMINNFNAKTKGLNISNQDLIIASIVEREAKTDTERPKIAAVYLNRLKIGMRLEADPTIQYGKGNWDPISKKDYKGFVSPYNTYLIDGLPPTPICNPGLESIKAVLNPEQNDYLFFFHKANGEAVFSKTFEEHLSKLAQ